MSTRPDDLTTAAQPRSGDVLLAWHDGPRIHLGSLAPVPARMLDAGAPLEQLVDHVNQWRCEQRRLAEAKTTRRLLAAAAVIVVSLVACQVTGRIWTLVVPAVLVILLINDVESDPTGRRNGVILRSCRAIDTRMAGQPRTVEPGGVAASDLEVIGAHIATHGTLLVAHDTDHEIPSGAYLALTGIERDRLICFATSAADLHALTHPGPDRAPGLSLVENLLDEARSAYQITLDRVASTAHPTQDDLTAWQAAQGDPHLALERPTGRSRRHEHTLPSYDINGDPR